MARSGVDKESSYTIPYTFEDRFSGSSIVLKATSRQDPSRYATITLTHASPMMIETTKTPVRTLKRANGSRKRKDK
jgi:hypothetical protein